MNGPRFKKRRCHFYDNNGRSHIREYDGRPGCPEGEHCAFAHPDDPQWLTADPCYTSRRFGLPVHPLSPDPPPPPPLAPPRDPPLPRDPPPPLASPTEPSEASSMPPRTWHSRASVDRDRGKEKEKEWGRLPQREEERVDPRSSTHYRDGFGRARDASPGASSIASSADPRAALRKMASTSSIPDRRRDDEWETERERERTRDRERERERERDRDWDRRYREEDRRRDDDRRREDGRRYDDRKRESRDDDYRRRDDEDRRGRRRSESQSQREFSEEEMRQMWADRVKLLSESVLVRTEYIRLQDDAQTYERLRNSAQYEQLPAEDRIELEKLVEDTKNAFKQKRIELNRTVARLIPRDYFPFAQPPERQSDSAIIEMHNILSALQDDVKVMHEAVGKLLAVPLLPATSSREASVAESIGDRPRKRRRLSVEPGPSRAQDANSDQAGPSIQELEAMKDGLTELTGRISNVENDLEQYSSKVRDEVEAQLDYQLPDFGVPTGKDKKTHVELTKDVDTLRGDVDAAEQRSETVLAALAKLKVGEDEEDDTRTHQIKQNEKLRQTIAEMEEYQKEMSKKLEAQTQEINALSVAVRAYISSPAQFPSAPPQLSATEIIATVRSPLLVELRQKMQPLLDDARADIEKRLQQQLDQVNGTLLSQITPTMRAVELVSSWVEKVSATPGTPTPVTTTASSASTVQQANSR